MHTAVIGCIGAVVAVMTSLFIEPWFPLGDWRWAVGVVAGLVLMVGVWVHKERRVLVTGGSRRRLHAADAPPPRENDERATPEDPTRAAEPVAGADLVRGI
ncbi:MAG: hypothetical protein OXQ84_01785, partial [bacterium]|nr:hypothetical protein [bacterium]